MKYKISVPSKTFLIGEYAVLKGGSAILLTTEPRFELMIQSSQQKPFSIGIPSESPAGKFLQQNFSKNFSFKFLDPYDQLGGFGASSAQFLMLFSFKNYLENRKINDEELLIEYKKFAFHETGLQPSGADLIAQLHGGVCFYATSTKEIKSFSWPFEDLNYCLIHTGKKSATHLHLQNPIHFNETILDPIIEEAFKSFQEKNSHDFIKTIKHYSKALTAMGLLTDASRDMLETLTFQRHILASKGCGALGADVILALFKKEKKEEVLSWLEEKNFNVITQGQAIASGLTVHQK